MTAETKQDILSFTFDELKTRIRTLNQPSYRAGQVLEWIYKKGVTDFSKMRNLPQPFRKRLAEEFCFPEMNVLHEDISEDGTRKILFELGDNEKIETVLIPTKKRKTICVSTQAGCKFGCRFCASGIGGWNRNLSAGEILGQIIHMQNISREKITHIVFMGVGEPLDNYENLMKAIRVINAKEGFHIGARRITVSTCGVIPRILDMAKEGLQIELAISLHGYDNESRNVLMPVNRKYPFNDLIQACREYSSATNRQITFEYILIKDVTCNTEAVAALKKSIRGFVHKLNLIPYNPVKEFDHETPSQEDMEDFRGRLKDAGIHSTIRTPRGRDIAGACGQLRHKN